MKLNFKFILFFAFLISFSYACSDDEQIIAEEKFELISNLSTFDADGGKQNIQLATSSNWSAKVDQSWCSVTPKQGAGGAHVITVEVQPNSDFVERNASLILSMGTLKKTLVITQKQKNALLLSSNKEEVPASGGDVSIDVKSNVDYSYAIEASSIDWIIPIAKRSLNSTTLTFKIKENTDPKNRVGHIMITSGELKESVSIFQDGMIPELVLSEDVFNVPSKGTEIKVELKSNSSYEVIMPDVDWLTRSDSRSLSSFTHYFAISANDKYDNRSADIVFKLKDSNKSKKVTVNQLQKNTIMISDSCFTVEPQGGNINFRVEANVPYSVECPNSWIHQVKSNSRALTSKNLQFQIEKNTLNTERTGSIIISSEDITKTIKINQNGLFSIDIKNELKIFGDKQESQKLSFSSLGDWTAHTTQNWCKISPLRGKGGDNTIHIVVDEITGLPQRTDTLFIQSGHIVKKIPIIQKNRDALIVVTPNIHYSGVNDTIITVKLKSAYDVKFHLNENDSKWILPLSSRSLVDSQLEFKILKNAHVLEREGKITFTNGNISQDFKITQDGLGLQMEIIKEKTELGGEGTDFEITVKSNFKYKVWFNNTDWLKYKAATLITDESSDFKVIKHRFSVTENNSLDLRIAYIYFLNTEYKVEFGQVETNIARVFQNSKVAINVPSTNYKLTEDAQELAFNVTSNVKYLVETPDKWIKLISPSDIPIGTNSLKFGIEKNYNIEERVGKIILSYGVSKKEISVTQEGFKDYGIAIDKLPTVFESNGGQQILKFKASENWIADVNADWCSISTKTGQAGANSFTITAKPNKGYDKRTAVIMFKCGKHTKQITIEQKQLDHIEVVESNPIVSWNTTKFDMKVKANCPYSLEITATGDWIKRDKASRGLSESVIPFVLTKNEGDKKREAIISLKYKDIIKKVVLTQNSLDSLVITTPNNLTIANSNDTIIKVAVTGTSKISYNIEETAKEWITLYKPSRGLSNISHHEYSFKISKQRILDRKGIVTFTNGSKSAKLTINQKGYGLQMNLNPTKVEVNSVGKEFEVSVASNFNYKIEFTNKWVKEVTATPDKPAGKAMSVNKKHRFVIEANPTTSDRELDIIFKNTDYVKELGEVSKFKVHVLQKAKEEIRVPKEAYTVPAKGQDIIFDAESNAEFKVKTTADWLRYEPQTRGFSKTNLKFVVAQSLETKPREAFIVLTSNLAEKKIKVTQEAFDDYGIRLIGSLKEFEADGGTQNLIFDSSRDWVISSIETWCKLSTMNGTAGLKNSVSIQVEENPTFAPRETKLVLQSKSGPQLITIKQAAQVRKIEIPTAPQKVAWDAKELKIMVKANCKYSIASSETWIKVKPAATKALAQKEEIFVLEPNKGTAERSATITFSAEGVKKTVTVTQGIETKK